MNGRYSLGKRLRDRVMARLEGLAQARVSDLALCGFQGKVNGFRDDAERTITPDNVHNKNPLFYDA